MNTFWLVVVGVGIGCAVLVFFLLIVWLLTKVTGERIESVLHLDPVPEFKQERSSSREE